MANNIIKLNRGDSYEFPTISIPEEYYASEDYVLTGSDLVCFAILYPHQRFEDASIVFNGSGADELIDIDKIQIKLKPKDTADLVPGVYYYTVKLFSGITFEEDGTPRLESAKKVRTLIERTKLIVNE